MARKREIAIGITVGLFAGLIIAYHWAKHHRGIERYKLIWYSLLGMISGSYIGYCIACVLGTKNDTVNYTLFKKNKRVYEGITFADRIEKRLTEHKMTGKLFTHAKWSKPKPRCEALEMERVLIKTHNPKYNKKHNNSK